MPSLSLDCLTLTDSSPADLIGAAAAAGFDLVSLWVSSPAAFPRMRVPIEIERECADLLRDTGVGVHTLEVLDLSTEAAIRDYRPALEMGARLGAKAASAFNGTNPDRSHVVDLLALFVEVVGEFGLEAVLEPVAMAHTRTLAEAEAMIRDAGGKAGILFDSWHLIRSGGSVDDLAALDPALIRYVQLNDGLLQVPPDDWIPEAMGERLYLGEGEFPLLEILRLLPADIPWAVETPSLRRARDGITPDAQARETMASLQKMLAELQALRTEEVKG
jgi:sugar phosphate isomerase/epimerase